jgi:hypothetical protein
VLTPAGERLTRAGAFTRNGEGEVVTMDGHLLLDEGGGPIQVPFEAQSIAVAADGTLSVDGEPAALIGLVEAEDATQLFRETGTLFRYDGEPVPMEAGRVVQGFLEQSNVNAVAEMTRMIAVQRAYEYGQKLMDQEDERIRLVVRTIGTARLIPTPRGERHASTEHRGDRHGGPADAGRGDLPQPRQHEHHRLQRPPRRVRRPALPADPAPRHDQLRRRHGPARRRAARPRRAGGGGLDAGRAGRADRDGRRARRRDRGQRLSRDRPAERRARLDPRRRAEAQRRGPDRHLGRLPGRSPRS